VAAIDEDGYYVSGSALQMTVAYHLMASTRGSVMQAKFFDLQESTNPLNGRILSGSGELGNLFDGFRSREPFFFELEGENGFELLIGVAEHFGCIQYSAAHRSLPYLMAVSPLDNDIEDCIEFFAGNTPTPMRRRHLVPFELVIQIAAYFMETGNRSPAIYWEEI